MLQLDSVVVKLHTFGAGVASLISTQYPVRVLAWPIYTLYLCTCMLLFVNQFSQTFFSDVALEYVVVHIRE